MDLNYHLDCGRHDGLLGGTVSAEGQPFGRTPTQTTGYVGWPEPVVAWETFKVERLTHAEQASDWLVMGWTAEGARVKGELRAAAEIERVAREVCAEAGKHYIPSQLGIAICRLRALVEGR